MAVLDTSERLTQAQQEALVTASDCGYLSPPFSGSAPVRRAWTRLCTARGWPTLRIARQARGQSCTLVVDLWSLPSPPAPEIVGQVLVRLRAASEGRHAVHASPAVIIASRIHARLVERVAASVFAILVRSHSPSLPNTEISRDA